MTADDFAGISLAIAVTILVGIGFNAVLKSIGNRDGRDWAALIFSFGLAMVMVGNLIAYLRGPL